jgi:hypothetical protein
VELCLTSGKIIAFASKGFLKLLYSIFLIFNPVLSKIKPYELYYKMFLHKLAKGSGLMKG